ncbi:DUF3293 domain-containing protein [Gemmatimonas sp.]|uniref:DUF3293 domain-containing protein n=1 Tax=Gemmatimonas sp. TaxID=1962908 RepID=UPI0025B7AAE9|nr:DUF3293 domain-containing protein [Gemmatimonas sp.]MCA2992494.1 DUF3293 domain-containing protein [Gemmatimonas sp.]
MGLNPVYFATRFRVAHLPPAWPATFVIVTAYATTGERWTEDENERANAALRERLAAMSVWHWPITGYDPETGHAEPGWAIGVPHNDGVRLGVDFRQDAVFAVADDALQVISCRTGETGQLGSFRDRLAV